MSEKLTVKIGSEEYPLKLTIGAMMDFEAETGRNVLKLLAAGMGAAAGVLPETATGAIGSPLVDADALDGATQPGDADKATGRRGAQVAQAVIDAVDLSMKDFATLLWACVGGGEEGSELTPRQIAGEVGPGNIVAIGTALVQAVMTAMPSGSGDEDEGEAVDGDDPTLSPTG